MDTFRSEQTNNIETALMDYLSENTSFFKKPSGGFNNFRTRNRHTRPYKSRKKNYHGKQHKRTRRQLRK